MRVRAGKKYGYSEKMLSWFGRSLVLRLRNGLVLWWGSGLVLWRNVRVAYIGVVIGRWVFGEISDVDTIVVGPRETVG